MADWYAGLVGIALATVTLSAVWLAVRMLARYERSAGAKKDAARRPSRLDSDATEDAEARPASLAARLDEVEYRFDALKRAHEQLSESIGTRFATMGKRITRGSSPAAPADAEDDPRQFDLLADIGPASARSGLSASHNGQRRLVARGPNRR